MTHDPVPAPHPNVKVVLVTGASSGIGKAAAIALKEAGWRVFATVRRREDVVALSKEGRGLIEVLLMDVSDEASVARALATVQARAGRLDALVNNAGYALAGPIELVTPEQLRDQLEVNVVGVHRVSRAALPMLRAAHGRIVTISSLGGEQVMPLTGAYSASKYAVEALSDAMRLELAGSVKVIVLQPGAVRTPIWDKSIRRAVLPDAEDARYPRAEVERLIRLFRRIGDRGVPPERVAREVVRALTMRNPPPRWPILSRRELPQLLLRWLPSPLTDRLKQRALRWPPRG